MNPLEVRYMLIRAMDDEEMPPGEKPEGGAPEGEKPAVKGRTRVIASTANPDRYDDVVDQSTWKTDRFMRNPVVPWGHDYQIPPVGKVIGLSVVEGSLTAEIEWDTSEHNALGRLVADQFASGFLSAVSVGFRPGRTIPRSQMPKDSPHWKEAGYGDRGGRSPGRRCRRTRRTVRRLATAPSSTTASSSRSAPSWSRRTPTPSRRRVCPP